MNTLKNNEEATLGLSPQSLQTLSPGSFKPQEVKFVTWSKTVGPDNADVKRIKEKLIPLPQEEIHVLDVGGGIGSVARVLADSLPKVHVDVVDNSTLVKQQFEEQERVRLIFSDFLAMEADRQYDALLFRTVLHHIIGESAGSTLERQNQALGLAHRLLKDEGLLFVVENFYEPLVGRDLTGAIIFECTRNKRFAPLFRRLGANTAGEGVRFRSYDRWLELLEANGFELEDVRFKSQSQWDMSCPLWQRLPFLCKNKYQAMLQLRKTRQAG